MQREATVQGEVHGTTKDTRALLQHGLDGYDAVVVEGRSPTLVVRELTLGYAAFLMGYVSLMWFQSAVTRLRSRWGGRLDLRRVAECRGVAYHDRIDADTAAVYEMVPRWGKRLIGGCLLALLALATVAAINRFVLVAFALALPYLYTTLVVVLIKLTGSARATYMAESITKLAEKRSYDRVVVLCGDAHREDVREALEARNWRVETRKSNHPLRRLFAGR